jgi:hypothetical protein
VLEQRGMVNNGNACYVNSTIQLLLGCSSFVSLLRYVAEVRACARHGCAATTPRLADVALRAQANPGGAALPTLHALVALAAEFPSAQRWGGHDPGAAGAVVPALLPATLRSCTRLPFAARAFAAQCAWKTCSLPC